MQAKMDQLLHHREELSFDEVSPENPTQVGMLPIILAIHFFQVQDDRLGFFFLERSSKSKPEYVKNCIMNYAGWLRKRIHPTDSEVHI